MAALIQLEDHRTRIRVLQRVSDLQTLAQVRCRHERAKIARIRLEQLREAYRRRVALDAALEDAALDRPESDAERNPARWPDPVYREAHGTLIEVFACVVMALGFAVGASALAVAWFGK